MAAGKTSQNSATVETPALGMVSGAPPDPPVGMFTSPPAPPTPFVPPPSAPPGFWPPLGAPPVLSPCPPVASVGSSSLGRSLPPSHPQAPQAKRPLRPTPTPLRILAPTSAP